MPKQSYCSLKHFAEFQQRIMFLLNDSSWRNEHVIRHILTSSVYRLVPLRHAICQYYSRLQLQFRPSHTYRILQVFNCLDIKKRCFALSWAVSVATFVINKFSSTTCLHGFQFADQSAINKREREREREKFDDYH